MVSHPAEDESSLIYMVEEMFPAATEVKLQLEAFFIPLPESCLLMLITISHMTTPRFTGWRKTLCHGEMK